MSGTPVLVARAQVGLIVTGVRLATMGAIAASSDVTDIGKGSYQLPDQSWHPARMWLQGLETLQVQEEGSRQKKLLAANDVQILVAGTDTFQVLRNFADPKKPEKQVAACFVKQLYNRSGYLLTAYKWGGIDSPEWNGDGLLLSHGEQVLVVPVKRQEFERLMLSLFGDHPGIAKQLQAGALRARHTRQIVALYVNWKQQAPK
ncbi:MAG: hypothetical protein H7Z21_03705 [Hymenobacter sp.]|nr:hypothetical protein [Hymenobacter sp.]